MRRVLAVLMLMAGFCFGESGVPIVHEEDVNFSGKPPMWDIEVAAANDGIVRMNFYRGTNTWDATGWTAVLKVGKNENDANMVSVTGTVSTTRCDFRITPSKFPYGGLKNWYSSVLLTSNSVVNSELKGSFSVLRSPEANSAALVLTQAIGWGTYTYTGTATNGPYRAGTNITFSAA